MRFKMSPKLVVWSLLGSSLLLLNLSVVQSSEISISPISGPPDNPRRHIRIRHPAELGPRDATEIYSIVRTALGTGYKRSGHPSASAYQGWKIYNTAPYLSVTHGNHYLNNYANAIAVNYGKFESFGVMPVGSTLAKDSFTVSLGGEIVLGPLFLMEKMPAGFNEMTNDWKFTQIQPDGRILGETNGVGADRVLYCIGCHMAAEHNDFMYFLPRSYRIVAE